jgi:hypothetical protein
MERSRVEFVLSLRFETASHSGASRFSALLASSFISQSPIEQRCFVSDIIMFICPRQ